MNNTKINSHIYENRKKCFFTTPYCPYSQPCIAPHSKGLVAVVRGANQVQVYSMGRWLLVGTTGKELCGEEEGVEKTRNVDFLKIVKNYSLNMQSNSFMRGVRSLIVKYVIQKNLIK